VRRGLPFKLVGGGDGQIFGPVIGPAPGLNSLVGRDVNAPGKLVSAPLGFAGLALVLIVDESTERSHTNKYGDCAERRVK